MADGGNIRPTEVICATIRDTSQDFQVRLLARWTFTAGDGGGGGGRPTSCRGPRSADGLVALDLAIVGYRGAAAADRGEPDRGHAVTRVLGLRTVVWGRVAAAAIMASVALAATPVGLRIIAAAAAGAGLWATYHALRERRGGVVGNQPFEWPRLLIWVAVCVAMIPVGGLIGLALVVFMILALAEFMPTL